ncbi:hypothetical protein BHE74_00002278 [Ensete ventricosum]|nr:hypothetical protein BHE74_00002278 [Ensete ventricosum]
MIDTGSSANRLSTLPEDQRIQLIDFLGRYFSRFNSKKKRKLQRLKERCQTIPLGEGAKSSSCLSQRAEDAVSLLDTLFSKAKGLGSEFSCDKLSSQFAAVSQNNNNSDTEEKSRTQIGTTIRGQAKARSLPPKKAVVKQTDPTQEVKNILGGLFKQETIKVDDDQVSELFFIHEKMYVENYYYYYSSFSFVNSRYNCLRVALV